MKKILFAVIGCLIISGSSYSQRSLDSSKKIVIPPSISTTIQTPLPWSKYPFPKDDTVMFDFLYKIDTEHYYPIDVKETVTTLTKLLDRSRMETKTFCFLPFLRLFDLNANQFYEDQCQPIERKNSHKVYGRRPPIQFLTLFYIHFSFVNPLQIKEGYEFETVELWRKNSNGEYVFLMPEDYNKLYAIYKDWIVARFEKHSKVKKNPLNKTPYKWIVKIKKR